MKRRLLTESGLASSLAEGHRVTDEYLAAPSAFPAIDLNRLRQSLGHRGLALERSGDGYEVVADELTIRRGSDVWRGVRAALVESVCNAGADCSIARTIPGSPGSRLAMQAARRARKVIEVAQELGMADGLAAVYQRALGAGADNTPTA